MQVTDEMVLAHARADAEFAGMSFDTLGRVARTRFLDRSRFILEKLHKPDTLDIILDYCKTIQNGRDIIDVFDALAEERQELDEEVIAGNTGEDGILGEGVDEILCVIDLIYQCNDQITKDEIQKYMIKKLEKWRINYG